MSIVTNAQERTRFFRFLVVGGIGFVVDFGVLNLLTSFGLHPLVAQAFSFGAAVISNFILNRYWTYPESRSKRKRTQLPQFFLVSVVGLGVRTPIFAGVHLLLVRFLDGMVAPSYLELITNNLALATAVGVVLFWNFFVNRYWTYANVK